MKNRQIFQLIFTLLITIPVFSDFRVVRINGGSISAAKKTTMSILDEQVNIKLFRDTCNVKCKFWIKSETQSENLQIAFPNSLSEYTFPGLEKQCNTVTNFTCFVDGVYVPFKKKEDVTKSFGILKGNMWFTFNTFLTKKTVHTIECFYTDTWYGYYRYLFGTATTWKGPIQKGRIVFNHSNICSNIFVMNPEKYKDYGSNDVLPVKLKPISFEDSLVYTLSNYTPDSTEIAFFQMFKYWSEGLTPEYIDTINIKKILGRTLYGFANRFKFNFLGDTNSYPFLKDYNKISYDIHIKGADAIRDGFTQRFSNIFSPNKRSEPLIYSKLSYGEKIALSTLSGNADSLKKKYHSIVNSTYDFLIDTAECKINSLPTNNSVTIFHEYLSNNKEQIRRLAMLYYSFLPINVKINGSLVSFQSENMTITTSIDDKIPNNGINQVFKVTDDDIRSSRNCFGPFQLSFKIIKRQ